MPRISSDSTTKNIKNPYTSAQWFILIFYLYAECWAQLRRTSNLERTSKFERKATYDAIKATKLALQNIQRNKKFKKICIICTTSRFLFKMG